MKKIYYLSLLMSAAYIYADTCDRSHTFFVPRKITTNSVFELALSNYHWYTHQKEDTDLQASLYITPFYQQSVRRKKTAEYFLRNNQECLTFREINENEEDICSLWFDIESDVNQNFTSKFTMKPKRRTYGGLVNINFAKLWNNKNLWFDIAFTLMRAEHSLDMCEQITEENGPLSNFQVGSLDEFTSVIKALNNNDWNFGRFSPCTLKRFGLDDIQLKVGLDWYYSSNNDNRLSPYIVATIPTGKKQRSKYIFEPLVGSKNWSLGFGLNYEYFITNICDFDLTWIIDAKYRYAFGANQCRSFDLCANGDWSRYLLLVPKTQTADAQPGINLLSLQAHVTPRSTLDIFTTLHFERDQLQFEVGYDFWWRQKEKVSLKDDCCFPQDYGILDLARITTVPTSASQANISQSAIGSNTPPSDPEFVSIQSSDLDLDSAAHPSAMSSTLFAALGWNTTRREKDMLFGLGLQYEIGHKKAALSQVGIWGKFGVVFN